MQLRTCAYAVNRKDEWQPDKTLTYSLRIVIPKRILKALPPGASTGYALFWCDQDFNGIYEGYDFGLQRVEPGTNFTVLKRYFVIPLRTYGGSLGFSITKNQLLTQRLGISNGTELYVDVIQDAKHPNEGLSNWAIVFKVINNEQEKTEI